VGFAFAILTTTIIVFSEVLPKCVASAFPIRLSMVLSPIILCFVLLLKPVINVLNGLTDPVTHRLTKGNYADDVSISSEQLRSVVNVSDTEGKFNEAESNQIKELLAFYTLVINVVLKTPRVDIIALPSDASFEKVRDVAIQNPFRDIQYMIRI